MSTTNLSGFVEGAFAWPARARPARHGWRPPRVTLMGVGLACGVTLVLGLVVAGLLAPLAATTRPPASPPVPATTPPVWIDIVRPLQLYGLSGSLFARLPLAYGARRRTAGIERQDTLSFGAFAETTPYLTLAITRRPAVPARPDADLVVDLARAAAGDGIALLRAGPPSPLPTRFGDVAVADVALRRGGVTLPCLGFRLDTGRSDPQPVAMAGLACGGGTKRVERADLACAIERIDLVSAGDDMALRGFFVEAERRRGHVCETARSLKMQAPH